MSRRNVEEQLRLITEEIDGALELLGETSPGTRIAAPRNQQLGSLMEQCLALCDDRESVRREPVRTIHHFACTGGTLFSKCLAAMPNVQLLSEVSPYSTLQDGDGSPKFAPTDIIRQMKQSTRGVDVGVITELFRNNLEVIHRDASLAGYRLVIRDHPHSEYCVGPAVSPLPGMRRMLVPQFDVISAITVRRPVQSWLSMEKRGWTNHFQPSTFEEYCVRYLAFMRAHAGVPVFRYEDLIEHPHDTIERLCMALDIPYSDQFLALFGGFRLTGDSGRTSSKLEHRDDWPVPDELAAQIVESRHYPQLMGALGYA